MSADLMVAVILVLNSLASVGLVLYALFRDSGKKKTLFMIAFLILICPVVGIAVFSFGHLFSQLHRKQDLELDDISFSRVREQQIIPPDIDAEMNIIPIKDAMTIANSTETRKLIIDILKNEDQQVSHGVVQAINNSDTEVSHYAAVAVIDALSEFRKKIQSLMSNLERYPDNVTANLSLLQYIQSMIELNVMSEDERISTIYMQHKAAEILYKHNVWFMKDIHYLWACDNMISISDYQAAETWVSRANEHCPNKLDTFKARLHLAYAKSDQKEFFRCLDDIRKSSIAIDNEIIEALRLYSA